MCEISILILSNISLLKLIEFLINFIQYNFLAIIIETDKQNFQNKLNIDLFMNIFSEDWSWE